MNFYLNLRYQLQQAPMIHLVLIELALLHLRDVILYLGIIQSIQQLVQHLYPTYQIIIV